MQSTKRNLLQYLYGELRFRFVIRWLALNKLCSRGPYCILIPFKPRIFCVFRRHKTPWSPLHYPKGCTMQLSFTALPTALSERPLNHTIWTNRVEKIGNVEFWCKVASYLSCCAFSARVFSVCRKIGQPQLKPRIRNSMPCIGLGGIEASRDQLVKPSGLIVLWLRVMAVPLVAEWGRSHEEESTKAHHPFLAARRLVVFLSCLFSCQ